MINSRPRCSWTVMIIDKQQRDMKGDRQRERTDQESDGAADGRPESTGFLASLVGIDGFNGFDFRRERGRGARGSARASAASWRWHSAHPAKCEFHLTGSSGESVFSANAARRSASGQSVPEVSRPTARLVRSVASRRLS